MLHQRPPLRRDQGGTFDGEDHFLARRFFHAGRQQHGNEVFSDPSELIGFVVTFGALVGCCFLNHRMFRDFYDPNPVDTAMVFVELAGVALLPNALASASKFKFQEAQPLELYDLVFLAISGANSVAFARAAPGALVAPSETQRL